MCQYLYTKYASHKNLFSSKYLFYLDIYTLFFLPNEDSKQLSTLFFHPLFYPHINNLSRLREWLAQRYTARHHDWVGNWSWISEHAARLRTKVFITVVGGIAPSSPGPTYSDPSSLLWDNTQSLPSHHDFKHRWKNGLWSNTGAIQGSVHSRKGLWKGKWV